MAKSQKSNNKFKNSDDNYFQYALTVTLNYQKHQTQIRKNIKT